MGFKFSQHRGGIGFVVASHGIQVFPTTGGHWVWGNQPWDSSFPNIGGHWVCGNQPWDSSFPNIGGHWVCGNQPWDSSFPNIGGALGLG